MENNLFTGMVFTDEPDIVAEGEYEFVIDTAEKKKSKNGSTDYLTLKFKIRNDVNQGSRGRVLFVNVFRDKENPQWYDYSTLKRIIATQKKEMPNGQKWSVSFEICDDCIQYLIGLKMRASVIHETYMDDSGDEHTKASIIVKSFKPTAVKDMDVVTPTLTVADNSDLPF